MRSPRIEVEFSLLDLLGMLRRHLVPILAITLLAGILATLAAFFWITPRYKAAASLLPGSSDVSQGSMPVLERGSFRGSFQIGQLTTRNSLNLEIMLSDWVRTTIVDSLDLVEFFGFGELSARRPAEARQRAMRKLVESTHFELSLQIQVLIVHVTTRDPEMSARIANTYLDVLQKVTLDRYRRYAREQVSWLDERIQTVRMELERAELRQIRFQNEAGVVDLESERDTFYALMQGLRSDLLGLQLRHGALVADQGEDGPEVRALAAEVEIYTGMLAALEKEMQGESDADPGGLSSEAGVGTELRLARHKREVAALASLEAYLFEEREIARLQSIMDMETITVLDRAFPPAEPIWPRRRVLIVLVCTCVFLTVSLVVFGAETLRRFGEGSVSRGLHVFLGDS